MAESVLVTGAGDSVGRVMAEKFLARGDRVHIGEVRADALAETLSANPGMTGSVCDVGDPAQVARMFADAEAAIGAVSVLVNTVGISGERGPMEELDIELWDRCITTNLSGAFYCMRLAIPGMKRARHGAIINFSTGSTRTRLPMRAPYIASKAGLEGLTLNAARELGPFNIRVNAILPGMINNARMQRIIRDTAEATGKTAQEVEDGYLQYISMRTKIEPAEIADMVLFLCSPAAAKVTGELVSVSGNSEWES